MTAAQTAETREALRQALIALTSKPGDVMIDGRYVERSKIIERARKALGIRVSCFGCGKEYAVTKTGRIWGHCVDQYSSEEQCAGSGQRPR